MAATWPSVSTRPENVAPKLRPCEAYLARDDGNLDGGQGLATTWPRDAKPVPQAEPRAMRRADQVFAVRIEKLVGHGFKRPGIVRATVLVGPDLIAIANNDKFPRFRPFTERYALRTRRLEISEAAEPFANTHASPQAPRIAPWIANTPSQWPASMNVSAQLCC